MVNSGKLGQILNIQYVVGDNYLEMMEKGYSRWALELRGGKICDLITHPLSVIRSFLPSVRIISTSACGYSMFDLRELWVNFWNAVFSNYARKQNKRYWAEKTPDNMLYADFYERCFDNLKIINVVRDGRDVACSNVSQNWGEDTLKNALDKWASQSVEILSLQEKMSKNQYINVRYEDIVLRTRPTLHRLTDFLEIDFDEAMLTHKLYSGSIGRYEDVWTPELKAYTRDRYGALLDQLGYSV